MAWFAVSCIALGAGFTLVTPSVVAWFTWPADVPRCAGSADALRDCERRARARATLAEQTRRAEWIRVRATHLDHAQPEWRERTPEAIAALFVSDE